MILHLQKEKEDKSKTLKMEQKLALKDGQLSNLTRERDDLLVILFYCFLIYTTSLLSDS